jgi:hypothetical protein
MTRVGAFAAVLFATVIVGLREPIVTAPTGVVSSGGFSTWYSTDGHIWRRRGDVTFNTTHAAYIGIAITSDKAGITHRR